MFQLTASGQQDTFTEYSVASAAAFNRMLYLCVSFLLPCTARNLLCLLLLPFSYQRSTVPAPPAAANNQITK
jgi:hypothetical protein